MAISDTDWGGSGWYSVCLRKLDERPASGKSLAGGAYCHVPGCV